MTTATNSVLTEIGADGIATITFNRPDLHNAIDESVIAEFKSGLAARLAPRRAGP